MADTPTFFKDAKDLLSEQGFAASNTWYHGTSSALVNSIKAQGLKRSGDKALKEAAKKTMATIGNDYTESVEPVFLTQSKELAFYWAEQTVRNRSVRIEGEEQPVVLAVDLPEDLNAKVKPDVGAASLLLLKEGEEFMAYLAGIYQESSLGAPDIDLMKAERMEYLHKLGMAYYDADIDSTCLTLINS
ncbi:hypothetical protein [Zhongshania aliphaticivorans]|uniref:hypothetical protein n=1 Tax=Zhongshania aliphaticivorans TaxID=1470434 RepID=UPI0012E5753E|nr:hypothetical protein [Zhongshania aliphaticivorans]CAA0112611.1 Uncharacterised protein [Zhongshania aliphaticivorans]